MPIPLHWPSNSGAFQAFLRQSGLTVPAASRALYLAYYARKLGGVNLVLESGRRSLERNRELQRAWDRGDRWGLNARPADDSKHLRGEAFDVVVDGPDPPQATWQAIGRLGEALGLRWGGRFQVPDPVHFDL